jgi:hypothetical protein
MLYPVDVFVCLSVCLSLFCPVALLLLSVYYFQLFFFFLPAHPFIAHFQAA